MKHDRKILFKGETITVVLHQSPPFVEMIFYGYTKSKEYRDAWNSLFSVKSGKEFNNAWLVDLEYMHVQPDDLAWAYKEWFPKALKHFSAMGKVSIVPPVNFVGNYQVSQDAKEINSKYPNIKIEFFQNFDEAKEWLLR